LSVLSFLVIRTFPTVVPACLLACVTRFLMFVLLRWEMKVIFCLPSCELQSNQQLGHWM
jgi:hypothetical protein